MSLRYRLEAWLFFALIGLFRLLGTDRASWLGGAIARSLGPFTSQHARARRNLTRALPDMPTETVEATLRAMWDNLGRTIGELADLSAFRPLEAGGRVEVEGGDIARRIGETGKGGLFVSGHFANWELMPKVLASCGLTGAAVYRAPNNPIIDRWLTHERSTHIIPTQIPKGAHGVRDLIAVLKGGGHVAMLVDQKMSDGISVPFFGRPAMTPAAAAQLSLRYGVPIIPAAIERTGGAHFRVRIFEPIAIEPTGDREADTLELLTRMNRFLEERIRARPAEWLWVHKRWPD